MRWFLAYVLVCLLAAIWIVDQRAYAHEWYESECCSKDDCSPLTRPIEWLNGGRAAKVTTKFGTAICDAARIRPSKDHQYHACILDTPDEEGQYCQCLYVPPLY